MYKKIKKIIIILILIPVLTTVFTIASADDSALGIGIMNGASGSTVLVYPTSTSTKRFTYIEASGSYGSDVAVFGKENGRFKIMVAGVEGWIDQSAIKFYPVTSSSLPYGPSHYVLPALDGGADYLGHKIKTGRSTAYPQSTTTWHPVNDVLLKLKRDTKYYSYDGHFFYLNYYDMLLDYQGGGNKRSVNPTTPYFNYFQFLPFRTQSKHTSQNINKFLTDYRKFTSTITTPYEIYDSSTAKSNESLLYNSGSWWIEVQDRYGSNALLNLGVAANESAWGRSNISVRANNLFGHSAFDSNPGSATRYKDVKTSIESHAIDFLNWSYLKPVVSGYSGGYYSGGVLGDKSVGANVFYASDPYWGEKAANQYRLIDRVLGEQDLYTYRVGVKTGSGNDNVRIRREPNTQSAIVGGLYEKYASVVILEEVTGESVSGNTKWYKIQSDHLMDNNRNLVPDNKGQFRTHEYDYANSFAYVHSSFIYEISKGSDMPIYTDKLPIFAFEHLKKENNDLEIKVSLGLNGVDYSKPNNAITYLDFYNIDTKKVDYSIQLPQITKEQEIPYVLDSQDKLSKKFAWFKGLVNVDNIPDGDYTLQLRSTVNNVGIRNYSVSNIAYKTLIPSYEDDIKQASIFTDHLIDKSPIRFNVRSTKNISKNGSGNSIVFNPLHSLNVDSKGIMDITGSAYNISGSYPNAASVTRNLIVENTSTYKQVKKSLSHLRPTPYGIVMNVPNGTSKDFAWYTGKIDLNEFPNGQYTFYAETNGNIKDFRHINDLRLTKFPEVKFNGRTVNFKVNSSKEFRIEMTISGSPIQSFSEQYLLEGILTDNFENADENYELVDQVPNDEDIQMIPEEDKINE